MVLLLTATLCIGDVDSQENYQPFSLSNLEKWRSIFEKMQSQKDYPVPRGYFKMKDSDSQNNVIFEPDEGISFNEYFSDHELEPSIPYGIQNVRSVSSNLHSQEPRDHQPTGYRSTFQSLCPSTRRMISLNNTGFDYRPDHYEEVLCTHSYTNHQEYSPAQNKVCSHAGFTCIQLSRTIYLTRKSPDNDCWESETRKVFAGCECMWPKHNFGDIEVHH